MRTILFISCTHIHKMYTDVQECCDAAERNTSIVSAATGLADKVRNRWFTRLDSGASQPRDKSRMSTTRRARTNEFDECMGSRRSARRRQTRAFCYLCCLLCTSMRVVRLACPRHSEHDNANNKKNTKMKCMNAYGFIISGGRTYRTNANGVWMSSGPRAFQIDCDMPTTA